MARLADRIWEMNWVPPQVLCYKPNLRSEEMGGFSVSKMRNLMESQRDRVDASPIYVADSVAEYFYSTAIRDHDLHAQDFPAVAIPEDSAFIEFRRPQLKGMVGGDQVKENLPHSWGWQISKHDPQQFSEIFRSKREVQPGCVVGLLCILWMSHDDKSFFAPLAAMGLQVAADGETLGIPIMSLGFANDPERVRDVKGLFGYFNSLFLPAVMAMAFMACKTTTIRAIAVDHGLNKSRVKKRRRPLLPYNLIDCDPIKEVLRYDGMAGVQGLAGAMRKCRSHFIQDMRGQSSLIMLPGSH